jgi:molecular chaperone DnaK (HSP70)
MEARCAAAFLVIAGLWDQGPMAIPYQDEDFGSTITRDAFLEMCQPMMDRWENV